MSEDECLVDFDGVANVSPLFFQDFIFPLVIEFGSHALDNRLRLINLKDEHLSSYQAACDQTSVYMDKLSARQTRSFGDISDLTCELLIKARELSRRDRSTAQLIFGINNSMAELFANMDIELIRRIANAGIICFEPRFSPEFTAKLAALDASEIDIFLNIVGDLEDIYEPGCAVRYALAVELLSLKPRISIVAKETGLSPAILRKAFVEMHQRSPSSGPIRTSPQFMSKSFSKLKEATLCAVFFRLENRRHCARRVINGYRRYCSYIKSVSNAYPLLDFSDAWAISKWLDAGVLKLVRCSHCRSAKLINNELEHNVCCVCKS